MNPFRIVSFFLFIPLLISAQVDRTDYFVPGEREKELLIIVHIWGEINNPGKFIVRDGTTLVDIISEAGGPTKFAKLNKVIIAHKGEADPHIEVFNMREYIEKESIGVPIMMPGDIVVVKRNAWGFILDFGQLTATLYTLFYTILILIQLSG